MTTIARTFLLFVFILGFLNHSICQKNQLFYSKGYKAELVRGEKNLASLNDSEKLDYFSVFDEISYDTVLLNKQWVINNPEKVRIINDDEIYINTFSHSIRVKDNIMVDSILIATKKRFPRPFRPKKFQIAENENVKTTFEAENVNSTLEVDYFRIVESEETNYSGISKKYMELCFNRKLQYENVCVIFYFEFKSGKKWKVNSGKISKYGQNQGFCLYEEVSSNSKRLGNSYEDRQIKNYKLKEDNIKSVKIEVYDRCWDYNYERKNYNLISSKEIKLNQHTINNRRK